jgi:NIPSNAP/TAT (twin-arginine translocation) pathway signal sequence
MNDLNRRDFLKTSLAASATAALAAMPSTARAADSAGPGGQVIELRAYRLKAGAGHALLDAYLEKAFIPALNARGIEAVGVFTEPDAKDGAVVWVLIPHPTIESVGIIDASLNADPQVQAAGRDYLASPTKDEPAFDRVDSWLFLPFSGLPRLAVPALAREGKPRIFEMRTYESYSEPKALKKVEMFNAGEIGVMQEVHLSPVFYGQALLGRDLPQLTYMLCSPDMETHKKNWTEGFLMHPVWVRLKNDPQYADTVSKITSRFLVPSACSQI